NLQLRSFHSISSRPHILPTIATPMSAVKTAALTPVVRTSEGSKGRPVNRAGFLREK
ncbi:MAG: hypothetical protein Q9163_005318, partial [Psora crenata]